MFRLSPAYVLVFTGVLKSTVESSENTKLVREVTDVFLHEEYDDGSLINVMANLKVGLIFKYEKQMFYILVAWKYIYIYIYVQSDIQIFKLNNLRTSDFIFICLRSY